MSKRRTSLVAAAVVALAFLIVLSMRWRAGQAAVTVPEAAQSASAPRALDPKPDVLAPNTLQASERATAAPLAAGDVAIAPIDGIVYGNRAPLHDASILFGPVGTEPEPVRANYVYTDREGKFTIHPARDVEHKVTVTSDGWSTATMNAKPGDHLTVNLESPRSVGGISGQVVDGATDQPVTDFKLGVNREDKRKNEWPGILSRHIQDAGGRFHEELPIAEAEINISVRFEAVGYRDTSFQREHVTRSAQVDLGKIPMEKIEGARSGTVVDDRDGAPIANARVIPISDKGWEEDSVTTNVAGQFTIEHQRAQALGGFVATADDFEPLYYRLGSDVTRTAGQLPILRLKQGVELRGKISGQDPLPKDLRVGYWSDEVRDPFPGMPNTISKKVVPDDKGEYVLTHVPARRVTVGIQRVVRSDSSSQAHFEHLSTVDCSDGQSRRVDFAIGGGFNVELKIVASGARKRSIAVSHILAPDGSVLSEIETEIGTSLVFYDVPRGNHVLRVSTTKERFIEVPVSVVDGPVKLGDVDISACFKPR